MDDFYAGFVESLQIDSALTSPNITWTYQHIEPDDDDDDANAKLLLAIFDRRLIEISIRVAHLMKISMVIIAAFGR